jgi:hypothetical protein
MASAFFACQLRVRALPKRQALACDDSTSHLIAALGVLLVMEAIEKSDANEGLLTNDALLGKTAS